MGGECCRLQEEEQESHPVYEVEAMWASRNHNLKYSLNYIEDAQENGLLSASHRVPLPLVRTASEKPRSDDIKQDPLSAEKDVSFTNSSKYEKGTNSSMKDFLVGSIQKGHFVPVTAMLPVHGAARSVYEAMPRLLPSKLEQIKDLYDPDAPIQGPYRHKKYKMTYMGQMKEGIPHGWGRIVTNPGSVIEGFFCEGCLHRFGTIVYADGAYYRGGIEHNQKAGQGVFVDAKGTRTESVWSANQADGKTKISRKNGQVIFQGTLKEGKREGPGTFYETSRKYEYRGEFREDKYHGTGQLVFDDGRVVVGEFRDGLPVGDIEARDDEGDVGKVFKGRLEDYLLEVK